MVTAASPVAPALVQVTDTFTLGGTSGSLLADGNILYAGSGNTVSVVDTTTNTVVATIPVGNASGLAISGDTLYVANWIGGDVKVVDATTNSVVSSIPMGGYLYKPMGVAINSDLLYIANYGDPPNPGRTVTVVDTTTNAVVKQISVGNYPYGIAASGDRVYATNSGSNTVSVIDTATNTLATTIPVGSRPMGTTVNGDRLYVANFSSNTVSVIDTTTNSMVGSIPVGLQPYAIAFSPDGTLGYVANYGNGTVTVIDTTTNTVVDTDPATPGVNAVTIGHNPGNVAVLGDGRAYVSDGDSVLNSRSSRFPMPHRPPAPRWAL